MVFVLRVVEGLDVRETAECLELNANTVRTRLFRAQRQLRGDLSRVLHEESSPDSLRARAACIPSTWPVCWSTGRCTRRAFIRARDPRAE